ncbi:MAG: PD40 domain-containing protein [Candidatus Hydrogenedentes bacterium]|nr:PD40 domain-containing protein [Candidatus Hydrogenedentota bacterium]
MSSGAGRTAVRRRAPGPLLGYTEYRTNLPTRHANQVTSRACVVGADGSGRRILAEELCTEPNSWTQFAGWTPDGRQAVLGRGWESPENAAWEEEHKTFRMTEGWLFDLYLLDLATGKLTNLTAVERVSSYNSGLIFLPDGSGRLGFTALISGISHPFLMDADGRNKRDVSSGPDGFAYGFSASPDGTRIAYHKDYQIYVAAADGSNARKIETGNPFNFVPQWSPDGAWLMFVSGEHYNCHPYLARPDGSELRKLADRGGFEGVTTVYDVYDFHGGSSDVPAWAADGQSVFYTAKVLQAIELLQVTLDGHIQQLTQSPSGARHYHPKPSPDGHHLAFGANRTGTRQIYVMSLRDGTTRPITQVPPGHGAMWAHWQPHGEES